MAQPTETQLSRRQHSQLRLADDVAWAQGDFAVHPLARLGYIAKGVVYLIMGLLALSAALGGGTKPTDQQGVFQTIISHPFGVFLLLVIAVGLAGYAVWCLCQGVLDVDGKGTSAKGIATRVGYAIVGVVYLTLAYGAFRLATGGGGTGKSSDTRIRDVTAQLLDKPMGVALVVLAGVVALAIAGVLFYRAWKVDFESMIRPKELGQQGKRLLVTLGRVGYAALGVVFVEVSLFLIVAALHRDPGEAQGLSGALRMMGEQPFGRLLLAVVALGLIAYGVYSVASGRYRRVGHS
jgi:Domain of Unknown Function (DUF1206)